MQTHGAPWNYEYYIPTSSVAIVTRCVVALSSEASVTFKTSSGSASRSGGEGGSSRGGIVGDKKTTTMINLPQSETKFLG